MRLERRIHLEESSTKLWTKQYTLILSLTFLFFLGLQALLGGFPVFVTEMTQNPANGGLMTTAFMLASVFTRPVMGMFMDKVNMKKVLIISLAFIFITITLCLMTESVVFLFCLRFLQGTAFGVTTTLLATFITNVIPNGKLGEGIGFFGLAMSVGTTIGPMIALFFIHSYSFHRVLAFSLFLVLVIFSGGFLIKDNRPEQNMKIEQKTSFIKSAFDGKAFMPCFLVMLFYITFAGIVNYIDGLGKSAHLGSKTSVFFLLIMVMLVLTRAFSGRIFDHLGHKLLIYPATVSGMIGLILIANTQHVSTLLIAAVFYGLAYGVMQPTFQAWAVTRVHPRKKATANAMAMSFMDFGQAIGAVALGVVVGKAGYRSMYGVSAVLIALMLVLYLAVNLKMRMGKRKAGSNMKSAS
jgi:MFS family permease